MKKGFFVLIFCWVFLTVPGFVASQEWVTANQVTITWDAVVAFENGDPIPATDIIGYGVYLVNETDTDKTNYIRFGVTTDILYTVTLDKDLPEGRYFVGLRTIRKLADGTTVTRSVIGWTDNPDIVLDGKTFGLNHYFIPMVVGGISHK